MIQGSGPSYGRNGSSFRKQALVEAACPELPVDSLIESYYMMNGIEIDKIFNNIEKDWAGKLKLMM